MTRTAADLKTAVAGYMHRDSGSFVFGGVDVLLLAMNNARMYTERRVDFELSRVVVDIPGVTIDGALLSTAVLHGTATSSKVKKLQACFLPFTQPGFFPIDTITRDGWIARIKRRFAGIKPTDNPSSFLNVTQSPFSVFQIGGRVFITPFDTVTLGGATITLVADAFQWLNDYDATTLTGASTATSTNNLVASSATFITAGVTIGTTVRNTTTGASAIVLAVTSETTLLLNTNIFTSGNAYSLQVVTGTDFLLTYCFDWLVYRCVWELNFFLKEDERVNISTELIKDAWESVLHWNTNMIVQMTDDLDLN